MTRVLTPTTAPVPAVQDAGPHTPPRPAGRASLRPHRDPAGAACPPGFVCDHTGEERRACLAEHYAIRARWDNPHLTR